MNAGLTNSSKADTIRANIKVITGGGKVDVFVSEIHYTRKL